MLDIKICRKIHHTAKSLCAPDRYTHMCAFTKLIPQSWKQTYNCIVCRGKGVGSRGVAGAAARLGGKALKL